MSEKTIYFENADRDVLLFEKDRECLNWKSYLRDTMDGRKHFQILPMRENIIWEKEIAVCFQSVTRKQKKKWQGME